MKYSEICYGLISMLGVLFLLIFFSSSYLKEIDAINILAELSHQLLFVLMLGGIGFLIIGIIGIGRLKIKNHRNLFTAIAAVLIPILCFVIVFFSFILIIVPASMGFPLRSEITNVSLISNSPLILSIDVKAITTRDTMIEGAGIRDIVDNNVLTYCSLQPFFELPADSTSNLILDYNVTLPSGNYILQLYSWHNNHGSIQFAIP